MGLRRTLIAGAIGVLVALPFAVAPVRAAAPSNDYFWDNPPIQWGLLQVGAPAAWTRSTGAGSPTRGRSASARLDAMRER